MATLDLHAADGLIRVVQWDGPKMVYVRVEILLAI